MTARHILTYACDLSGGGVERAQLRLARGWLAAGRRVTLVIGDTAGPLAAEMPAGLDLIELGTPNYLAQFRLPGIVRDRRPDVIFCAGNFYTSIAAWTRLRLGRDCPPIVGKMSNAAARGDHGPILDLAHRIWLTQHRWFLDHMVAMTPATAAEAGRMTRMRSRTSVIPNPPAPPVEGAPLPALPRGRFVLGVGRLVPQKRWDRLIAALPALPDDVALAILGEGELRPVLERQVAALGLQRRVQLLGHTADPLPAMARAALLALPSDYEGVPGVLREALSVGTPVVTTDCSPAVAEIVADHRFGSIVQRDDAGGLAAALTHWLAAPRPDPVPQPGTDSAARYLRLFDSLV
ncbi:glycosyltransferase [Sphingomonas sp. MA1305]|uniref:glycosyltransferase n=1 Tax=Sphingomonas sp. MA1305 TaxID=2479204 RepID=UPI0018DFCB69|nr:glycosyltransferase [Sphingomonas sp. MA1305]MBI0475309.1 glycosyltransferase [Sphingomonas sp. MA1305]